MAEVTLKGQWEGALMILLPFGVGPIQASYCLLITRRKYLFIQKNLCSTKAVTLPTKPYMAFRANPSAGK